ncbi:hypothetical protein [Brevibacillus reuszeri]|uniref:hypothetical protein n=1 Tax=Brevibacillus reuszeri TaxID=54915 RepID=UPI000CCBE4EC|nr:hypothetical protein [Brevibacillus reuszeri]
MEHMDARDTEPSVEVAVEPEPEKTYSQADIDAMKAEWDGQLKQSQTALQQQTLQHVFYRKATEQGVADADKLMQYVNLSGVTFDESGQPQGIDEIISAIQGAVARKGPKIIGEHRQIGDDTNGPYQEKSTQSRLEAAAEKARQTGRPEDRAAYSKLKQLTTFWR